MAMEHSMAGTTSPETSSTVYRDIGIEVIRLDNPPVNALSSAVKTELNLAFDKAQQDAHITAIVIIGEGQHFCGGADIKEFGQVTRPSLSDLCVRIEQSHKPVVAAINGTCLGGGLELALACHYRVAASTAKLGLPEVGLGLIPGAGGTQRAPRLMGCAAALELILGAKPIAAQAALTNQLVDQLVEPGEVLQAALAVAQRLTEQSGEPRRSCDMPGLADTAQAREALEQARNGLARSNGLFAPQRAVEAVQAAIELTFEQGLAREKSLFEQCRQSPQRAGLIHAFMAERKAAKVPELAQAQALPVTRVGVIGAGTMGTGISLALLDAGYEVILVEREKTPLQRGVERIRDTYDKQVSKGRISEASKHERLARLTDTIEFSDLKPAQLVIEAVFEDLTVKQELFTLLGVICREDTILASNTSYLDVNEIARVVINPQRVIGIHFFSPANIMKLVEIIVAEQTDATTTATAFALATRLRKTPVRAGVCDGFIGNRMLAVYREAADLAVLDGASPYQVDQALRAFGFAMGPYQVMDLAGGDIAWATRQRRAPLRDPRLRQSGVSDALCQQGWFGQKSGRGYYLHEPGSPARPNPQVAAIVEQVRQAAGIKPVAFSDEDIAERYLMAMINEGANLLNDRIALRPSDIDVVLVNGYGFPRHLGGPMYHADQLGLANVLARLERYAERDPLFWRPSSLLVELAGSGRTFEDLNAA
ncbi:3-hydroxyacyl-CoA dehydrogenase [Pseudomonas sp. S31]|uniref:3-hydroxyacyl-CoA dehydrogenase NAD-binding domain-containing protein n=1 Tax=Pseudomonas sp. S31 TaxID=1564473 RepID=UPI002E2D7BA5|nr:3-hydroxyacyl-CoA dehydrogenase NAD-binding domain-containing protein [Pseudomonas sp. S31]MBK4999049.1 3-hydroxyacyl-CoA dehydrogenase [Pseudomonas sp. S31]